MNSNYVNCVGDVDTMNAYRSNKQVRLLGPVTPSLQPMFHFLGLSPLWVSQGSFDRSSICLRHGYSLCGAKVPSRQTKNLRTERRKLVARRTSALLKMETISKNNVFVVYLSLFNKVVEIKVNEKVSNHGSIPITIDCNVVAFIVFEEGFHQPIKRTKKSVFLDVTVFRHTVVD
ncbi:hypothetical protein TNCV_305201 [Trichonephila clavipes]|nr:hypothetical protein TNCV_305201 [Trichonephila clavipes]